MDWIDNSAKWKNFPKRSNSLTFLQSTPYFGSHMYQVIPFKGTKIAYSENGDFNFSFINEHIEDIFENLYDVGLNYKYGDGYSPSELIRSLLFYEDFNFKWENNIKQHCDLVDKKIINNELDYQEFKELQKQEISENYLIKTLYPDFIKKVKNIKDDYIKGLNKNYNNYYDFIDFLLEPYSNKFQVLSYTESTKLDYLNHTRSEFWIDGEFIMINKNGVMSEVLQYLEKEEVKLKGAKS